MCVYIYIYIYTIQSYYDAFEHRVKLHTQVQDSSRNLIIMLLIICSNRFITVIIISSSSSSIVIIISSSSSMIIIISSSSSSSSSSNNYQVSVVHKNSSDCSQSSSVFREKPRKRVPSSPRARDPWHSGVPDPGLCQRAPELEEGAKRAVDEKMSRTDAVDLIQNSMIQ